MNTIAPWNSESESLETAITDAENLRALCDALNTWSDKISDIPVDDRWCWEALVDVSDLPTWGSWDDPPLGVYSWDATSTLIQGNGSPGHHWEVVPR